MLWTALTRHMFYLVCFILATRLQLLLQLQRSRCDGFHATIATLISRQQQKENKKEEQKADHYAFIDDRHVDKLLTPTTAAAAAHY